VHRFSPLPQLRYFSSWHRQEATPPVSTICTIPELQNGARRNQFDTHRNVQPSAGRTRRLPDDARRPVQRSLPSHLLEQGQEFLVTMTWLAHSPVTLPVAMSRAANNVVVP
jgi:hypothetical protein